MNPGKYAYLSGNFVPIEEAKISIMTHAFNYGTGCFEGIRAYWNPEQSEMYVFRLADHYKRLERSGKLLMMDLPASIDELCNITVELLRRNEHKEDTYIRPLLYKSSTVIGVRLHDLEHDFALFTSPMGQYVEVEEAAKVCVSSWQRVTDNSAPARAKITGTYINAALSKTEASLDGYDEAIVLTDSGHVSEGSAENIFLVMDGVLVTPPVSDNILSGITRSTLITIAKDILGIPTVERSIDRTELYVADEIFLCGTGAQVVPVGEVDRRRIGNGGAGPITSELKALYENIARGIDGRYPEWRTPVYNRAAANVADSLMTSTS